MVIWLIERNHSLQGRESRLQLGAHPQHSRQVARICARAWILLFPYHLLPIPHTATSTSYRYLGEQTTTASMLKVLQLVKRHHELNFMKKSNL